MRQNKQVSNDASQLEFVTKIKWLLVYQFIFCLIFSLIPILFFGFHLQPLMVAATVIGFFNGFGAYCQWRAFDISLSKTALFTQADDFIGMLLGYLLLNEVNFLVAGLIYGILFRAVAGILITSYEKNFQVIKFVTGYSLVWGVASFLYRYFALQNLPTPEFLVSWYAGASLSVLFIATVLLGSRGNASGSLSKKEISRVGLVALPIWLAMVLGYVSAQLSPITVYQPIFMVSEAVIPSLIGLYFFKEKKSLILREKVAFVIGITGVLLISLSF